MKHKFNIATYWGHFNGRKVVDNVYFYTLATEIEPPGDA